MSGKMLKRKRTLSPTLPSVDDELKNEIQQKVTFSVHRIEKICEGSSTSIDVNLKELTNDLTFMSSLKNLHKGKKIPKKIEDRIFLEITNSLNFNNFYIPSKNFNVSINLPNINENIWEEIKSANDKSNTEKINLIRKVTRMLLNKNVKKISTSWIMYDTKTDEQSPSIHNDELLFETDSIETLENFCNDCSIKDDLIKTKDLKIKQLQQRCRRVSLDDSMSSISSASSNLRRRMIDIDLQSNLTTESEVSDLQSTLQDQLSKLYQEINDFGGRIGGRRELTAPMITFVIGLLTKSKLSNRQSESILESLPKHLKIFTK
jgi:hypothetical protein